MKQSLDSRIGRNGSTPTVVDDTVFTERGHSRIALGTGVAGERLCLGVGELAIGLEERSYLMGPKMGIVGEGVVALRARKVPFSPFAHSGMDGRE